MEEFRIKTETINRCIHRILDVVQNDIDKLLDLTKQDSVILTQVSHTLNCFKVLKTADNESINLSINSST